MRDSFSILSIHIVKISLSEDLFAGSTAIAVSYEEPVAAAKVIKDFSKEYNLPTVKGILF